MPCGGADLIPQVAGLDGLVDLAIRAPDEVPVLVILHGSEEVVGETHRVVGVLSGNGVVRLAIEVVAEREAERFGELLLVIAEVLHALDHRRDLEFLAHLPGDERLDVGVVGVEADHLGGASGRAAGFDRPRGTVADAEKAHEAGTLAAAGEWLILAPEGGEIRSRARAVLEKPRLAGPEVHDAAFADEVVLDGLDEAGVGLGMGIGIIGEFRFAGGGVIDPVPLGRAGNAVCPVEAGIEPLGAVGGGNLMQEHVGQLVVEGLGVLGGIEVVVGLAPVLPAPGKAMDDLADGGFRSGDGVASRVEPRRAVRRALGDAGSSEILAHHDVGGELGPLGGNLHIVHLEHDGPVGVGDSG